jgi:deoxycytidine triphosphate deaminase
MILGANILKDLFNSRWTAYRDGKPCPFSELHVNANSIDVTLGPTLLQPAYEEHIQPENRMPVQLDYEHSITWEEYDMGFSNFRLNPGAFALGCTRERFDCQAMVLGTPVSADGMVVSDMRAFAPMYEGRSTLARVGLMSHLSAGFGDWGFQGAFTLELFNCFPRPIMLSPGMRIGQVYFIEVKGATAYEGAYSQEDHYDKPRPPKLGPGRI